MAEKNPDKLRQPLSAPKFLEFIVFVCGMATMILELTGSRIFAPYLGTSLFVWTSLIGIVLGSLSLGYWWGGKISDKNPSSGVFSRIIFFSGVTIGFAGISSEFILMLIQEFIPDVRLGAVMASLILFGVPGILLGMISPYAVRLKLTALGDGGKTVGSLYALSTLGSICGTFLAGFVLLAYLSSSLILWLLCVTLILVSLLARFSVWPQAFFFMTLISFLSLFSMKASASIHGQNFVDVNTPYNRVWIFESKEAGTGFPMRVMQINDMRSSGMYLDDHNLAFLYTRFYRLVRHFKPDVQKTLLIGGAGFSYPRDFLREFPHAEMDVVEIDPGLTELAKKYFKLEDNPRLHIHHMDGRVFLNRATQRYDAFFGDAFNAIFSIPFHLTTQEAIQKLYDLLNDDGVAFLNVISAIEGPGGQFLRAELATLKKFFPQVYVFAVRNPSRGDQVQNLMIVALKSKQPAALSSFDREMNGYLRFLWKKEIPSDMPVLTDDFAPIDRYVTPIVPKQGTLSHRALREFWENMTGKAKK